MESEFSFVMSEQNQGTGPDFMTIKITLIAWISTLPKFLEVLQQSVFSYSLAKLAHISLQWSAAVANK